MKNELSTQDKNTMLIINRFLNRVKDNPSQTINDFKIENRDLNFNQFIFQRITKAGIVNIFGSKRYPQYVPNYDKVDVEMYKDLRNKIMKKTNGKRKKSTTRYLKPEYSCIFEEVFSRMNDVFTSSDFTTECRLINNSKSFSDLVGNGDVVPAFLRGKTTKVSKFTYKKIRIEDKTTPKKQNTTKQKPVVIENKIKEKTTSYISILWGLITIKKTK